MAGAMVGTLAEIGDGRHLPLLKRLRTVPGSEEIQDLDSAISALEQTAGLLRPTCASKDKLLRPTGGETGADSAILLKPSARCDADD